MAEAATFLERSDFSDAAQLYEAIFSGNITEDMIQSLIKTKRPRSQEASSLIRELLTGSLFPPVYSRLHREGVELWLLDYLDLLHASGKIGQFFENIIIADFLKYGFILPQRPRFFFWQKSAASEVDLVISSRGQIIPVEIKYSATFQDKMLRGIRTFRKDHTTSGIFISYSILIYNGEFYCPEENIFCLPAWLFV